MYRKQGDAILSHSEYLEQRTKARQQNVDFERKKKLYLLIGGRSGRIKLHKDPATGQLIQVIDDEASTPALELAYDFLSDPSSSLPASLWSLGLVIVVLLRFLQLTALTLDGPHFYKDASESIYPFLPTRRGHESLFIAFGIPLLVDSIIRMVFFAVVFADDKSDIYKRLVEDSPFQLLTALSVLGMIPIFVAFSYGTLLFESTSMSEIVRIILRLLTVCIIVHIYRHVRHYTLIKVVVRSIMGASRHLALPLMTFLMFNITFGVIFYFFEPCFNEFECHWHDLLEATAFVVVTTTTTGYGNQYPQLHGTRVIGVIVMLFGSLYLSMPLALIGNEYVEVLKELEVEDKKEREELSNKMAGIQALRSVYTMEIDDLLVLTESSAPLTEEEATMEKVRKHHFIVQINKVVALCKLLLEHSVTHKRMTPNLILIFAEIKATTGPLHAYLKALVHETSKMWISAHEEVEARDNLLKEADAKAEIAVVKMDDYLTESSSSDEDSDSDSDDGSDGNEEGKKNDDDNSSTSSSDSDDKGGSGGPGPEMTDEVRKALDSLRGGTHQEHAGLQDDPKIVDIHNRDLRAKKGPSFFVRIEKAFRKTWNTWREGDERKGGLSYMANWNAKVTRLLTTEKLTDKERLWMMFNLPRSSREAKILDVSLTVCVIFSLVLFFMESTPTFSNYGETTVICGDVLRKYCADKRYQSDPGCFVQAPHGIGATTTPLKFPDSRYLESKYLEDQKDCYSSYSLSSYYNSSSGTFAVGNYTYMSATDGSSILLSHPLNECFGQGFNFGTTQMIDKTTEYRYRYKELLTETNVTCLSDNKGSLVYPDKLGFQTQSELALHYGSVVEDKQRDDLHKRYAICQRPECVGVPAVDNLHLFFSVSELFLGTVFTLDFLIRINLADTYVEIFMDKMLYVDFLALLPFYVTVIQQYNLSTYVKKVTDLDFTLMSSSPQPYIVTFAGITKLLRGFKLARVFKASQVLVHTARNVSTQLFAMLGMFTLILFCFSIFFFELERGKPCYVGEEGCELPSNAPDGIRNGDRIYVDKNGDYSFFTSILDTFWFCFVSSTTVGYGDKYPITNQGKVLNFVLMLFGAVYMVFPLTVASTTFYSAYSKYLMNREKEEESDLVDRSLKISVFTSSTLYPKGYSDSMQRSLQFVIDRTKQANMEMMELQADLFGDAFSEHHHEHQKRQKEREKEGAGGKGSDRSDSTTKQPFEDGKEKKKEEKGDLENLETETDEGRDDEANEDGDGNDNDERKKKSTAPEPSEEERVEQERKLRQAALLADHSSLVTRTYEVADNLLTLLEGNMGSMEALAYFCTEADAYNIRGAKEHLAKVKQGWKGNPQHMK